MTSELTPDPQRWDAVVVGSGMGGMSTAAFLVTNGLRTLVLEQHDIVGGCSQVFRRKNSYEFDTGCHYVGDCAPGGAVPIAMRALGLEGRVEFEPMDPEGFDVVNIREYTCRIPRGWDEFCDRLVSLSPDQGSAIRSCLAEFRSIGESADRVFAPAAADPANYAPTHRNLVRAALGKPRVSARIARAVWQTADDVFNRHGLTGRPREVIGIYTYLAGLPTSKCPAVVLAFTLQHYVKSGGWYPRGGGQIMAAHLADVIKTHGGTLRTKARVERILIENGRASGVRLENGEVFRAPVIVSNADVKRTYLNLIGPEHLSRKLLRRARRWNMVGGSVGLYLGVDIDLRPIMPKANLWIIPTNTNQIFDDCDRMAHPAPGQDPRDLIPTSENLTIVITSGTVKDPGRRHIEPSGHSSLEVLTFVPPSHEFWGIGDGPVDGERYQKGEHYLKVKEEISKRMLAATLTAFPAIDGHIVWQESSTPISHERYTLATGGNWAGVKLTRTELWGRPRATTEIPGLYHAGMSTLYGPGIAGAIRGGVATASSVIGRDLWAEAHEGRVFADPTQLSEIGASWDPYRASKGFALKRRLMTPVIQSSAVATEAVETGAGIGEPARPVS